MKIYIMCGPAGSGKSTWVREQVNKLPLPNWYKIISRDDIRFEILNHESGEYFDYEDIVQSVFYSQIYYATRNVEDVVPWDAASTPANKIERIVFIDATHLTPKSRKKVLDAISPKAKAEAEIYFVNFATELEECIANNAKREGYALVPENVVRDQWHRFNPATVVEFYGCKIINVWPSAPRTYVTSDLHFGHDKSFLYEPRGYKALFDMELDIVERWNNIVRAQDDVYVLGDLVMGTDLDHVSNFLQRLNGKLHIIRGNHDTDNKIAMYTTLPNVVEVIGWATVLKYKKWNFYLCHYPTSTGNFDDVTKSPRKRTWCLCGHSHVKDPFCEIRCGVAAYHVELDAHNNKPVCLDDIIEDIKNFNKEKD